VSLRVLPGGRADTTGKSGAEQRLTIGLSLATVDRKLCFEKFQLGSYAGIGKHPPPRSKFPLPSAQTKKRLLDTS
jgi:hypothetical protein